MREGSRFAAMLSGPGRNAQKENQVVLWKPREKFVLKVRDSQL